MDGQKRIGILGASGYTGAELLRLLGAHPQVRVCVLSAETQAGKPMAEIFPHLAPLDLPLPQKIETIDFAQLDAVFCALPHGVTQEVVARLPRNLIIIDLSADFRLKDTKAYAEWYGHTHRALELQADAVYGLSEINRAAIRNARLIANPGCYPTATQLALIPLLQSKQILVDDLLIDAKSGVSGAGREAKQASLYAEIAENLAPYGVTRHRHVPEIEQGLSIAAGQPVRVSFTPHLIPMARGILASVYVKLEKGQSAQTLHQTLTQTYAGEAFVRVLPMGVLPATKQVTGSNLCLLSVAEDWIAGRAIVFSVIDNLVKGAAGQAVQNLNIRMGWPETLGLGSLPLYP